MNDDPLVRADGLVVGHHCPVCRPVSFELRPGEILGLAGPNGSGKTTLLNAIVDAEHVLSGNLVRRRDAELTVLQQRPGLPEEAPFTGADLLRICKAEHRDPPPCLLPLLPKRMDMLSGGQVQLLHVWACLGCRAALVLLDEPTNHLDPDARARLADMVEVGRADRGLLLVSHDRTFLEQTCNRVVDLQPATSQI